MKRDHKKRDRSYRKTKKGFKLVFTPGVKSVNATYSLVLPDYYALKKFFAELYMLGEGNWPDKSLWPRKPGIPHYVVTTHHLEASHRIYLTIKFTYSVELPDGRVGSFFRIGGEDNSIIQKF